MNKEKNKTMKYLIILLSFTILFISCDNDGVGSGETALYTVFPAQEDPSVKPQVYVPLLTEMSYSFGKWQNPVDPNATYTFETIHSESGTYYNYTNTWANFVSGNNLIKVQPGNFKNTKLQYNGELNIVSKYFVPACRVKDVKLKHNEESNAKDWFSNITGTASHIVMWVYDSPYELILSSKNNERPVLLLDDEEYEFFEQGDFYYIYVKDEYAENALIKQGNTVFPVATTTAKNSGRNAEYIRLLTKAHSVAALAMR